MSNTEYTVHDIHDILESYYKVARKRFVDNICMQAADYHLVTGPETPFKLFSSSLVNRLSRDELKDIAGEDASTVRQRINLKKTIRELEEGRRILLLGRTAQQTEGQLLEIGKLKVRHLNNLRLELSWYRIRRQLFGH